MLRLEAKIVEFKNIRVAELWSTGGGDHHVFETHWRLHSTHCPTCPPEVCSLLPWEGRRPRPHPRLAHFGGRRIASPACRASRRGQWCQCASCFSTCPSIHDLHLPCPTVALPCLLCLALSTMQGAVGIDCTAKGDKCSCLGTWPKMNME